MPYADSEQRRLQARIYSRKWYQKSGKERYWKQREKIRAYQRAYYAEHQEQEKQRWQRRYQANKDSESARKRRFYQQNRTKVLARCKAYNAKSDRKRQYAASYFKKNKSKIYAYRKANTWISNSVKSKRRAATTENHKAIESWERNWRKKASVICYWCNCQLAGKRAQLDHIVALLRGGSHSPQNVCISCPRCNRSKGAKSPEQWNLRLQQPTFSF